MLHQSSTNQIPNANTSSQAVSFAQSAPGFSLDVFFEEPLQDIMDIFHYINQDVFSLSDLKLQKEVFQQYLEQGLIATLPVNTAKDDSLLFSFKEKVWLSMIGQMQSFGFGIETIGKVKENLFAMVGIEEVFALLAFSPQVAEQAMDMLQRGPLSPSQIEGLEAFLQDEAKNSLLQVSLSLFELLLIRSIAVKQEGELMLLPCGTVLPIMDEMLLLDERITLLKMQPHLSLSLNSYILEYVSKVPKEIYQSSFKLSSEEVEIIRQMRSGMFKEVKVEFNHDKRLNAMEMVQDKTISKDESFSLDKMIHRDKYHKVSFTSNHQRGGYLQRIYRKRFTSVKAKK